MPPVIQRGLFQAVVPSRFRHELPQSRCADVRACFGYVCAFNKGQQRNFGGHIAFTHFGGDVVHIGRAALDGAVEIRAVGGELVFVAANQGGIDFVHAEIFPQSVPYVAVSGKKVSQSAFAERAVVQPHHRHPRLLGRVGFAVCPCGGEKQAADGDGNAFCVFHGADLWLFSEKIAAYAKCCGSLCQDKCLLKMAKIMQRFCAQGWKTA